MKNLFSIALALALISPSFAAEEVALSPAPVVVELFESQGCSSCPPAEKVLKQLHDKYGEKIIPLSFHVDYFDSNYWKDTYSNPLATQRQNDYTYAFSEKSLYTPEMVIQGEVGFVGSHYGKAESEIEKRLTVQRPRFELKQPPGAWSGKAAITFTLPSELNAQVALITVIVTEDFDPVLVTGGENTTVRMSSDYTVTQIFPKGPQKSGDYNVELRLPSRQFDYLTRVAVLLQGSRHNIIAAESLILKGKPHA